MSASLVGSEMCIRDSASSEGIVIASSRATLSRCAGGAAEARRYACQPVSYTHLTLPTICSV
eukprot:7183183-Alexandrium_andersonii.AAC.1